MQVAHLIKKNIFSKRFITDKTSVTMPIIYYSLINLCYLDQLCAPNNDNQNSIQKNFILKYNFTGIADVSKY